MIPAAILNGTWIRKEKQLEFSILQLSPSGFSFRAAREYRKAWEEEAGIFLIRFFAFDKAAYSKVEIREVQHSLEETQQFYDIWQVEVRDNPAYVAAVRSLTADYMDYVHLVQDEEMSVVSEKLVGYPAQMEECYPESHAAFQRELSVSFAAEIEECRKVLARKGTVAAEQGIVLEAPWQYERFLSCSWDEYVSWFFEEAGLPQTGDIHWLYVGSQVCFFLLPQKEMLIRILEKCRLAGKEVVLQLPPVKEHQMEEVRSLLDTVEQFAIEPLEVVVNDWGMLKTTAEKKWLLPTPGIMLLKQKKDPRYLWKNGMEQYHTCQDIAGWAADPFRSFLKNSYRVEGFTVESTEMNEAVVKALKDAGARITVYAPWYQMNTSTLCPLAAAVEEGDRGRQRERKHCNYHCQDHTFLYPSHLKMCGRYNTIWGYDADTLKKMIEQEPDRIVWNYQV